MPTNPALKARVPDAIQRKGKAKAALLGKSYGTYLADLIEMDTKDLEELRAKFFASQEGTEDDLDRAST